MGNYDFIDEFKKSLFQESKTEGKAEKKPEVWQRSVGSLSNKQKLSGLVVKKKTNLPAVAVSSKTSEASGTNSKNNSSDKDSCQSKTSETSSNEFDKISANHSKDSCDSSDINKSANQSDCNNPDSVYSTNQSKEKTTKKEKMSFAIGEADTALDQVKLNINTDKGVVKASSSQQTGSSSYSSGALGLLGAYSDSENDSSD